MTTDCVEQSAGPASQGRAAARWATADCGYTLSVSAHPYALEPDEFLGAINASRDTLGKTRMKLLDIVAQVKKLTDDAPYAIIGGLAQILWARKTHTDDLDVALASCDLAEAFARISGPPGVDEWALPKAPDRAHEEDDVFEVVHATYAGAVVDLISFKDEAFTREIIDTGRVATELGGARFIRPELLLICHLLRPTIEAKLAAVELTLSRRARADFDEAYTRRWAEHVGSAAAFERILQLADNFGEV